MKIYISGKITGDPDYRDKFERAAAELQETGHIPLNPAAIPDGLSREDYMRIDFAMIDAADAVLLLPDWFQSDGAGLEVRYCDYVGKPYNVKLAKLEKCVKKVAAE